MKTLAKRSLAIFIAVLMLFSVMAVSFSSVSAATNFVTGDTIYMRPNSQWKMDSARFTAYFFTDSTNTWVNMTDTNGDGYFEAIVPAGTYSKVIFCRMDGSSTENNWDNVMNQTSNLEYDGVNDCFELTGGDWNGSGTWSVYAEKLVYFVNTKGWTHVAAYCVNTSLAGDIWPGDVCEEVDSDMMVYAVYPGLYPLIRFTDYTTEGEYTGQYNYADVMGKYIEPKTGGVYNSASEAWTAANAYVEDVETTPTTPATQPTTVNPASNKVALAGSFNDWSLTDNAFEYYGGVDFHHAVVLAPGTYTFKVVMNDLWFGANTIIDGSTSSDIQMDATAGDCAIESAGGRYDLYFNTTTYTLSVLFTKMEFEENKEIPTVALSGSFNGWVTTDTMESVGANSYYYPACDSSYASLNTALASIDVDNSKEHRMEIALVNGIEDYAYTPEQNTAMLKLLKAGKLLNPDIVVYYPACDPTCTSLNAALTSIGVDNSKAHRMEIALINGMTDYAYTAEQNTALLKLLKAGKLLDPDAVPSSGDNIVSKTIDLARGEYYFSIVENGLWYGNANLKVYDTIEGEVIKVNGGASTLVTSGGSYTFEYNYQTNTLTITAVTEYNPTDLTIVSLSGDFNNWAKNDVFGETSATTVEKTLDLKRGTYHFKVVQDGLWYGNNGTIEDTTTKTSSTGWAMEMSAGDCILQASGGSYTFIYTVTTKMLTVEFTPSDQSPAEMANVTLSGDFNDWGLDDIPFAVASDTTVEATLSLTAGSYDFKVVEDGLWYGNDVTINNTSEGVTLSYTGSNCHLVTTGGDYTFTYDVMSKLLVITAELTEFRPVELSEVYLAGDFNDWDSESTQMTEVSDSAVSATMTLKPGVFYFKVVKDGLWYGNPTSISNKTKDLPLSYTASECILVAAGGEYTFTFDVTTNKLSISYVGTTEDPAKTAKVSIAGDFNEWSSTATPLTYYATNEVATTVELDAGYYAFKIVDGDLWYGWDEDTIYDVTDYPLPLSYSSLECGIDCSGGKYTFIYDVITRELRITVVPYDTDPAESAIVEVAGEFNNWNMYGEHTMYCSAKNTTSITIEITAGTYLFKIVHDGLWYGSGAEIADTTDTSGIQDLSMTGSECKLVAKGGVYTFNYNVVTHKLEILFEEKEYDYTKDTKVSVAGEFNNWNPDITPMSFYTNDSMYVDVPLDAGDYYFKIVQTDNTYGHTGWFGNTGGVIDNSVSEMMTSNTASDILLKAKADGTYRFIYNVLNNKLSVIYIDEDLAASAMVSLVGDFNEWDDLVDSMSYKGKGIFTITVDLDPGVYEFKIASEGTWYGNNGIINNTTAVTSDVGWAMTATAGNCSLKANGGSYTFNYNFNTNFLEVIYKG